MKNQQVYSYGYWRETGEVNDTCQLRKKPGLKSMPDYAWLRISTLGQKQKTNWDEHQTMDDRGFTSFQSIKFNNRSLLQNRANH